MKKEYSKNGNFSYQPSSIDWKSDNSRIAEVKISETICFGEEARNSKFQILGISEDIGPQMNNGLAGAKNGFRDFLSTFQNIQSNRHLNGKEIGILGEITQNSDFTSHKNNTGWIEELDDFVVSLLNENSSLNQTIIVIGGGHNNAYPLLKHQNRLLNKDLFAINIDPHGDCRATDFRHSGNPFSYAINQSILKEYKILGLHQSYNNEFIYNFIDEHNVSISYFEDYIDNPSEFISDLRQFVLGHDKNKNYTLDLDLDSISFVASSAYTPSGFSIEECRRLIRILSSGIKFSHFHLPEGSPKTDKEIKEYAKMISYFVADFIKSQNNLYK